jgi:peptidoglycan lytic transglycosylase D
VQRAIKRIGKGDPDFWTLSARPRLLPRETREYVPMILAAIIIARNPAQYGFSFESEEQAPFETVKLPRPVDLRHVAEWAGTTLATLRGLNPELRRQITPIKDADYELRVPVGTSAEIARRLDQADAGDLVSVTYYTVKRGETLLTIARKVHILRSDLAEANDLRPTARLSVGQQLVIPSGATPVRMASRKKTSKAAPTRGKAKTRATRRR